MAEAAYVGTIQILYGTENPMSGSGLAAPTGTIFFRTTDGVAFKKTGSGNTAWTPWFDRWLLHDEDFEGEAALSDSKYETSAGASNAPTIASPGLGGLMDMQTGALLNNTSGGRLKMINFNPRTRTVVADIIIMPNAAVTDCKFSAGLSDEALNPDNGGNGVFARYDTAVPDSGWKLIGMNGGARTVSAGTGTAPSQGTRQRLTILANTDGSAELLLNGVSVATIPAASVGDTLMRSIGFVETLAIAGENRWLQVDRIRVWQDHGL